MKYPRKKYQNRIGCLVFFMDTVWIVEPLGQAICLYTKLQEVFVKGLDPIRIVKANKNLWEIELFLHEVRICKYFRL